MPPLTLMIKPASGLCNLRCKYCFYHDVAEKREVRSYGVMREETLEKVVKNALEFADGICTFAFQGGEPTLTGLDFYKKLIELQEEYNTKKVSIHNAIQTNGIHIDDEWAAFFAANRFLVGLSLDGVKDLNDLNRVDENQEGSYARIMHAVQLFDKHKVQYNILTVITKQLARNVAKTYSFFKKHAFQYVQFIPCLDPLGEERGQNPYSLTPEDYTYFLNTLFDLWYADFCKGKHLHVRYFENIIGMAAGMRPESCGLAGQCMPQTVVEADGSVYPCDFYVLDEYKLGNLAEEPLAEINARRPALGFVEQSRHVDEKCMQCRWLNICRGGCRRDREPFADGKPALNYFCASYDAFFSHCMPRILQIAGFVRAKRMRGVR